MTNTFYFRVDCNPPRSGEYSLPIAIETDKSSITHDEVFQYCVDNKEFHHDPDEFNVIKIEQINYPEYQDMVRESYQ